ncbi:hypothetical protein [Actinobaculum sp. 352]|uniref:hypothetical protein n=1 Tax=Actinobaculum sp. 352 TaxID=2490946 RepID=UPI000F7E962D|nr:hypothetical protein [Actinobaculum sp. 352]RTE49190.1 hypothetical protein EKN07_06325 [Actinobaculum sp. 352]
MKQNKQTPRGVRVALIAALAFLLCACGAKIDTALNLADDGSGERVITLVMERDSDAESEINGGFEAVEAAINNHLPGELSFSGLEVTDDKATGSFTLSFSDLDEYRDKVASLLAYSGSSIEPDISVTMGDSPLQQGFAYSENFTSRDLLGWLPDALVTDGVISDDNRSNVFDSLGNATITVGSETYSGDYGDLDVREAVDNRFSSVTVVVTPGDATSLDVSVVLGRWQRPTGPIVSKEDEYLESIDVADKRIDEDLPGENDYERSVGFTVKNTEELAEALDAVFLTSGSEFQVTEEPSTDGVVGIVSIYTGQIDTANVCSSCDERIDVVTGADSDDDVYASDGRVSAISLSDFSVESVRPVTITEIKAVLNVSGGRDATLRVDYTIPEDDAEAFGDIIAELLDPSVADGTLTTKDADGLRTYTVELSEPEKSFQYPAATFGLVEMQSGGDGDYRIRLSLSPQEALGGVTAEKTSAEIQLPRFNSFTEDAALSNPDWTVEGGTATLETSDSAVSFTAAAKGMTTTALVVRIVLSVLLVIAIVLAILFRKKIAASVRKARTSSQMKAVQEKAAQAKAASSSALQSAGAQWNAALAQQDQQASTPGGPNGAAGPGSSSPQPLAGSPGGQQQWRGGPAGNPGGPSASTLPVAPPIGGGAASAAPRPEDWSANFSEHSLM